MRRTITRWVKGSALEPLARWVWRRVAPPPPPELPENSNESLYAFMRDVLRADSNCVDIGASFGGYLEQMNAIAPRGRHHAFEPIPQLAADLQRRFPGAVVQAMALSDRSGTATFHHFPDVSPFSGLQRRKDVAYDERVQLIEVPLARLDDVLPAELPIALIKVDVEGAELDVLRGARRTIERCRPYLIVEHDLGPAAAYGATPEALHALVADEYGYAFCTAVRQRNGERTLSRDEFLAIVRDGRVYNFIAVPLPAPTAPAAM